LIVTKEMTPADQFERALQNRNHAEPVEIWRARNVIHQDATDELSLTKVAKAVNISANHLSEKFKQVTGVNFVTYVARIRFENARGLLHDPEMRVSEVAFAAGFQSLSQFNRVFKKFSGKSPSEYRADYLKGMQAAPDCGVKQNGAPNNCRKNALSEV
jgi:AraC-like DNA-binding protein